MNTKYKFLVLVSVVAVFFASCSESFFDSTPKGTPNSGDFYKNEADFNAALAGVYNSFHPYRQDMEYLPMIDMCTPIAASGGGRFGLFHWGGTGFTPTNMHSDLVGWWGNYFGGIARANDLLNRLDKQGDAIGNQATRDRMKGECLYLRAQFYFFLTNLWGDVPLYTSVIKGGDVYTPKTPRIDIWDQLIQDLTDAETLLPSVTTYRANNGALLGHASKGSAMALRGKLLCYEKRWDEAETVLKKLIDSKDYDLTPGATGFGDQFLPSGENGIESIFEIQYSSITTDISTNNAFVSFCATTGSYCNVDGSGNNYIEPTDYLTDKYETKNGYAVNSQFVLNAASKDSFVFTSADPAFDPLHSFNNRDPRLMYTVMYQGNPWMNKVFPLNKFTADKPVDSNYATMKYMYLQPAQTNSSMNMVLIRYADVLLLYAEALMEQNKLSDAAVYVNKVRSRPSVVMPDVPAAIVADQARMRSYIHDERIRELSCEYGHVLFDMLRWGTYIDEMHNWWIANRNGRGKPANTFDQHNTVWPIPQSEINANPNLKQNPGY
jgi:starch-binding outer membrane protein, SusD/RagB family